MRTKQISSTVKVFETKTKKGIYKYFYLYFKQGNTMIRINTGIEWKEGLTPDNVFFVENNENKTIYRGELLLLKQKVDEYLTYKMGFEPFQISQEECNNWIKNNGNDSISNKVKTSRKTLINSWDEFIKYKDRELNGYKPSMRDYISLGNALKEYESEKKVIIALDDINEDFMYQFRNFLTLKHPNSEIIRGNLSDITINKRFSCMKTFLRYCESNYNITFGRKVMDFKAPVHDNDVISLSKEDIKVLKELNIERKLWCKVRDLFIFNCFCGLRYSDLVKLRKYHFYKDSEGMDYIKMENQKTHIVVDIPVLNTSLDIIKKYDWELPQITSQVFNRELKNILEHYKLFEDVVVKKRRQLKVIQDYTVMRRELISSHTCRRTYITLCLSAGIPINVIMTATGHKKVETLMKYAKKLKDASQFKKIDL